MGLDQYLYKVKKNISINEYYEMVNKIDRDEYGFLNDEQFKKLCDEICKKEIGYWRKHYELDHYMECIYRERGGTESFTGKYLELTYDDIKKIMEEIKDEHTTDVMLDALTAINKGYKVWYCNWW